MATKGLLLGTVFNPSTPLPSVPIETTSVANVSGSFLQSSDALIGAGATWTIVCWAKRNTASVTTKNIFHVGDANTDNSLGEIKLTHDNDNAATMFVRADLGGPIDLKEYQYSDLPTAGGGSPWESFAVSYDANGGGSDILDVYYNGSNITNKSSGSGVGDPFITKTTDGNPDQTDTTRAISLCGAVNTFSSGWTGRMFNWALWDTVLTDAAILSLYNAGNGSAIDYRNNVGNYSATADLVHYFRFANGSDRGENLGNDTNGHNVLDADFPGFSFVTDDFPS